MAEAFRVLSPGGVFVMCDNDPKSPVIQNLPPVLVRSPATAAAPPAAAHDVRPPGMTCRASRAAVHAHEEHGAPFG